jgi:TolB-like protein/Tfp pilus assembly protein PilF
MGVVYRATDKKLDRSVALKFLPPELTRDPDAKRRFVHEAKAASSLQHNNICTIHEIDETDDGHMFIVMDCYEGRTLKDLVEEGPLSVNRAVEITLHILSGLTKAHEAGMLHRDIKPANIMITPDGIAKILDFGLAKLAGRTKLTHNGTTVGTVSYMSPEQARGDELDARSDIFAMGVVLYELLAGKPPFRGDHEAAVVFGIMNNEPEPLTIYRSDVPDRLRAVISTALHKNPTSRYPAAAEMAVDLKRLLEGGTAKADGSARTSRLSARSVGIAGATLLVLTALYFVFTHFLPPNRSGPTDSRIKIAVLPFENLGDAEDEYFADGITEEVTARLAKIHSLGVVARTSVIQYKNTKKNVTQIGEELDVMYILEGTIRWQHRANGQSTIRVTPQLIRVSDGTHVWAELYQETLNDIFEVQARVAIRIAEALDITLLDDERRDMDTLPTQNLEAYQAYLRGVALNWAGGDELTAVAMFQRATTLDPSFALAFASLSRAHSGMYLSGKDVSEKRADLAKEAAARSLKLQPELPEGNIALGLYYLYCMLDFEQAERLLRRAAKRRPNDVDVKNAFGDLSVYRGDIDSALIHLKTALELDPQNADIVHEIGWSYTFLRRYAEAIRYQDRAIAIAPDYPDPYSRKARDYILWRGDLAMTRKTLIEAQRAVPTARLANLYVKFVLELMTKNYETVIADLSTWPSEPYVVQGYHYPRSLLMGMAYQLLGDSTAARQAYNHARVILETEASARPHDLAVRASLGLANAGLGHKDSALMQVNVIKSEWQAVRHPIIASRLLYQVSEIYVMVREYDAALDQIEYLLTTPSLCSVALLSVDPRMAPLRGQERFLELLEKYALENS